jgi:parallel beta-helix repeat protein
MKYALLIVFILGVNCSLNIDGKIRSMNPRVKINQNLFFQYTIRDPIEISDDTEFNTVNGVTGGIGTKDDPYSIDRWNITCDDQEGGIHIYNTTKYFIVRNCWIKSNIFGIFISNVSVGTATIVGNMVQSSFLPIFIGRSGNSTVNHNTCKGGEWGIQLYYSGNVTVSNNNCSHNSAGIWLFNSNSSIVANNICLLNHRYGIGIIRSTYCSIIWNKIQENKFGVYIHNTSTINVIHHNTFRNNTIQADDNGINNKWYDSETNEGNYWSDYNGTESYRLIAGEAGARDPFPLAHPPTMATREDFRWNVAYGILFLLSISVIFIVSRKYKRKY